MFLFFLNIFIFNFIFDFAITINNISRKSRAWAPSKSVKAIFSLFLTQRTASARDHHQIRPEKTLSVEFSASLAHDGWLGWDDSSIRCQVAREGKSISRKKIFESCFYVLFLCLLNRETTEIELKYQIMDFEFWDFFKVKKRFFLAWSTVKWSICFCSLEDISSLARNIKLQLQQPDQLCFDARDGCEIFIHSIYLSH